MAWPNPWRRKDENTRTCWGYTFQWTKQHLSEEETSRLKHSYDVLADECLGRLEQLSPASSAAVARDVERGARGKDEAASSPALKRDPYRLLQQHAPTDEKLGQLWEEVNTVPDWVNWQQIQRGQEVFYRYGGAALTGLAYQSLLGGTGANRVAEVLARTGGFSVKKARHRLLETTQFILQCTGALESVQPGGAAHVSAIRVRLLHAAVRRRIMALARQRPDYYDTASLGVPINDLDCMATIATFSATMIWLSLPRQGIWMREEEIKDYVALWRLVAFYMGTPHHYFESAARTKAVAETLFYTEVHPSETSRILAHNILKSLEGRPPSFASHDFMCAVARWLNGNELADQLGLSRPSAWYWALAAGQCIFFMGFCYFYRSIPYLDRRKVRTLRRVFYAYFVHHQHCLGEESIFEFKYVPDFAIKTERGELGEGGLKPGGAERRGLKALVVAALVLGGLFWLGFYTLLFLCRRLHSLVLR
ncbi:MAG: hypothetical protein M1815_004983 [Lichina confinis]|nr:MAG: hypothetical protein M1815_004983 [Lichina confinis]